MVGFAITVTVFPDKRNEFLQAFVMLKELKELGDSRLDYALFEQIKEPNTFLWLEHWQNIESLNCYYKNTRFKAMMGAIEIMGQLIQKRTFLIDKEKEDG